MMLTSVLAFSLLAAPQTAPDDDPVRVALYGRPSEVAVAELIGGPAAFVGKSVHVRGRFERVRGEDVYRICEQDCVRLVPEQGLEVLLRARAAEWSGQAIQVTGVFVKEMGGARDAEASFRLRFWRISMARQAEGPSLPGDPLTLETLVYAGGSKDGTLVRVRGRFRGANLHNDLPMESRRGREDWIVKDDYYAIWVTGRAPEGTGWKLDPRSQDDTRAWLEISGRPETRKGYVYLRAEAVTPLAPPAAAEAAAPPPARAVAQSPPPVVVFLLPLESDDLPPSDGRLLIQFNKQMDPTSFPGRVRLRYAGETATFEPAGVTYDAARRTLLVAPGTLTPERDLEVVLMDGVIDTQGQGLVPRQGATVAGVVEALRYRVAAVAPVSPGS